MSINLTEVVKNMSSEILQVCKDFASINGSMMREDMYTMLAASIMSPEINDTDFLLEIGTFRGLTAVFIAKVLNHLGKNNKVVSIDPFQRLQNVRIVGNYNSYMNNIIYHEVKDQCFVISAYSQQIAPIISGDIPFILIDGGHSYEDAINDFKLYLPKLKIGGIAYIDDPKYPGVIQAINEYIRNNNHYEILEDNFSFIIKRLF